MPGAVAIVIELSCCLDYNQNGALALRLDSLYNYMIEALTLSAERTDVEGLETCASILNILTDAWRQAIQSTENVVPHHGEESELRLSA